MNKFGTTGRIKLRKEDLRLLVNLSPSEIKSWKKYGGFGFDNTNPNTRKQIVDEIKRRLEVLKK